MNKMIIGRINDNHFELLLLINIENNDISIKYNLYNLNTYINT